MLWLIQCDKTVILCFGGQLFSNCFDGCCHGQGQCVDCFWPLLHVPDFVACVQQRHRQADVSAQSEQRICHSLTGKYTLIISSLSLCRLVWPWPDRKPKDTFFLLSVGRLYIIINYRYVRSQKKDTLCVVPAPRARFFAETCGGRHGLQLII